MAATWSEPTKVGTFFALPPLAASASGQLLPYMVAAGGMLSRMSPDGLRAFCACLDGVMERAVLPTLTSLNWGGSVADMRGVNRGGEVMFGIAPALAFAATRAEIQDRMTRGADGLYWSALCVSAFSLMFTASVRYLQTDTGGRVTLYPYVIAAPSDDTGGLVSSVAITLHGVAATADMEWTRRGDEAPNPWYTTTDRPARSWPCLGVVADVLTGLGSYWHSVTTPSAGLDFASDITGALRAIYEADAARNYWTRPTALADGPGWITPRRSAEAWGVVQAMIARMCTTVARFGYDLSYNARTRRIVTRWALALDEDGRLVMVQEGDPEEETIETTSGTILKRRTRSIGVTVLRATVALTIPAHGSGLAKTVQELQAIEPRFLDGRLARIPLGAEGAQIADIREVISQGEGVVTTTTTDTTGANDPSVQSVWPHPGAASYVRSKTLTFCDRVDDLMWEPDLAGRQAPATRFSVRTVDAPSISEAIKAHAEWMLASCGYGAPQMPSTPSPDASYIESVGAETLGRLVAVYALGGPMDGEKFLPSWVESAGGEYLGGFDPDGDPPESWTALADVSFGPDPSRAFGDAVPVEDDLTHGHGEAVCAVEWAWKALPARQ